MPRLRRSLLGAAAACVVACAGSWLAGEVSPLTLYQKTARAALVARVRATDDSTRRPTLEVLHVFKGDYTRPYLTIVPFRQDYASEKPWLRSEVFREGREYVLFLDPYHEEAKAGDFPVETPEAAPPEENSLFVVLNAHLGVLDVPAEGGEALTGALERFASILALREFDLQARAFRALLREPNPYLLEAGLDEVARFRLATEDDLDPLEATLGSVRPSFRRSAAEILGQIGDDARRAGRRLSRQSEIVDRIAARALTDEAAEVRAESARSLGLLGGPEAGALLRRISRQDADQQVRYSAEVALAEIEGGLPPPRHR